MDYCTAHFGKTLNDITIEDIKGYFVEERIETDQLEFKSISTIGSLTQRFFGIQRIICALLNSGGGLIIWGSPEGHKKVSAKEKIFKGELSFFDEIVEKDSVISKISDSITPLPNTLRLKIFSQENKSMMLIEVDPSAYSPHQYENIYYMRIDGQTRPAPHHYIEALFKKITYPNIEARIKIINKQIIDGNYVVNLKIYFFNWSPFQNEESLSFRAFSGGIFGVFPHQPNPEKYKRLGHEFFNKKTKNIVYYGEPVSESETLTFVTENLENNLSFLSLWFGGKHSPMKTSRYDLDFNKFNNNDFIVTNHENQLLKDWHVQHGNTKDSIMDTVLNPREF